MTDVEIVDQVHVSIDDSAKRLDNFVMRKEIIELATCRYALVTAVTLCKDRSPSIFRVVQRRCASVECHRLPLFDGVPQVTDSLRRQNINWKGIQIIKPENNVVERDFSGLARREFRISPIEYLVSLKIQEPRA